MELLRLQNNDRARRRKARSRPTRRDPRRRPDLAEARGILLAMGLGALLWAVAVGLVYACWPSS